jgi:hypothetical protein
VALIRTERGVGGGRGADLEPLAGEAAAAQTAAIEAATVETA